MFDVILKVINCILLIIFGLKYLGAKDKQDRMECLLWMILLSISTTQL